MKSTRTHHRILLGLLFAAGAGSAALAAKPTGTWTEKWKIAGKKQELVQVVDEKLLISRTCRGKDGRLSCGAGAALAKADWGLLEGAAVQGGADPGALLCGKLGGRAVDGTNTESGSRMGFCVFPDGSAVANASLHSRAAGVVPPPRR
jgi:hypothetical protein